MQLKATTDGSGSVLARPAIKSGVPASPARASPCAASLEETTAATTNYEPTKELLIDFNQRLLKSIVEGDYETYNQLCADDMSCMEPESHHQVVIGKAFHKHYFDIFAGSAKDIQNITNKEDTKNEAKITTNVTMSQPHIQWLGKTLQRHPMVAVLSYVKLTQILKVEGDNNAVPVTIAQGETRVWELRNNEWKCVHFHKSQPLHS